MTAQELYTKLNIGFELTVPSGITVTMRLISLPAYLRNGAIPSHLQAIVSAVRDKGIASAVSAEADTFADFFNWVLCEALIDPQVSANPEITEGLLPLDYLPEADKLEIFKTALGSVSKAVEALRPLSKRKTASTSSSSTPSPDATGSAPAA